MKKAFTLAEVLITLVVIGIVAAITIPIIQQKYEKRALYSQFMKTYSTLNQAMSMSISMGSGTSGYDLDSIEGSQANAENFLNTYIKPYVRVIKTEPCWGLKGIKVKHLAGGELGEGCDIQALYNASDALILQDGSAIAVLGTGRDPKAEIIIDVNAAKGPNVYGRDIHMINWWANVPKPRITGSSYNYYNDTYSLRESWYKNNCNPSGGGDVPGDSCADRLLREGKMAY